MYELTDTGACLFVEELVQRRQRKNVYDFINCTDPLLRFDGLFSIWSFKSILFDFVQKWLFTLILWTSDATTMIGAEAWRGRGLLGEYTGRKDFSE